MGAGLALWVLLHKGQEEGVAVFSPLGFFSLLCVSFTRLLHKN
jgi:hypothetical protein